jgi:hypothetical protein
LFVVAATSMTLNCISSGCGSIFEGVTVFDCLISRVTWMTTLLYPWLGGM